IGILRPGSGYREIIFLEDIGPVVQGQGTGIPWYAVDRIAERHLVPGPGRKLTLQRIDPVGRQVDECAGRLELRRNLELDLTNIWLVIGLDGRKQLVIFNRA